MNIKSKLNSNTLNKLIYSPNNLLTTPTIPVDIKLLKDKDYLNKINEIIGEMKYVICNIKGFYLKCGLAISANQIGYNYSLFIMSRYPLIEKLKHKNFDVFINPEITYYSDDKCLKWEGCLSDNKNLALIERPKTIHIKYYNINGQLEIVKDLSPVKSRVIQHEVDHLNGIDIFNNFEAKSKKISVESIENLSNTEYYNKWFDENKKKNYLF